MSNNARIHLILGEKRGQTREKPPGNPRALIVLDFFQGQLDGHFKVFILERF